jgi:hypothetical protein
VSYDWLLCGDLKGLQCMVQERQVAKAAVVTTMPMADQEAIRTMVREILQEHDQ